MVRAILCVVVALSVSADVALAKGSKSILGTIKKVDAATGAVTVTTTKTKGSPDARYTVVDTTKIVITNADGTTKELKGKDGLKDAVVKEKAPIKLTLDPTGTTTVVEIGGKYSKPPREKTGRSTIGKIKKADAAAGVVTVTRASKKKGAYDKEYKVADATKIVITGADGTTKELKGKDGLKDAAVKQGASVQVASNAAGAVTEVAVGGSYSKSHKS